MTLLPSLYDGIRKASALRPAETLRTPLTRSAGLSRLYDCEVLLKCEHLQTTGSFKYRGASNKLRILGAEAQKRGVVTGSSGNHGQALALAGSKAGIPVRVYAVATASPLKLDSIRAYGAELRLIDGSPLDAELAAVRDAKESGRLLVSAYNDLDIVAGQGTCGLEIVEHTERVDAVFVSVGGGGLIGGIGAALRGAGSRARVVGCWPEASPALMRCLEAGKIIEIEDSETISDGTAGNLEPDAITLPVCAEVVDQCVAVSESAITRAMWEIARTERWIVEGAAGVALAGLEALREQVRGKTVVVVICGRNIDARKYLRVIAPYGES